MDLTTSLDKTTSATPVKDEPIVINDDGLQANNKKPEDTTANSTSIGSAGPDKQTGTSDRKSHCSLGKATSLNSSSSRASSAPIFSQGPAHLSNNRSPATNDGSNSTPEEMALSPLEVTGPTASIGSPTEHGKLRSSSQHSSEGASKLQKAASSYLDSLTSLTPSLISTPAVGFGKHLSVRFLLTWSALLTEDKNVTREHTYILLGLCVWLKYELFGVVLCHVHVHFYTEMYDGKSSIT